MVRESESFAPKRLFRELKWEVGKAVFLRELLNAAILFFALNIILTVFRMGYLVSLLVACIWLGFRVTKSFRKNTIRKLEEGNPEIHEVLRTAYDVRAEKSLMVQGLLYDLQRKMSTVSAGVLLSARQLLTRFVILLLLAATPIVILSFAPGLLQTNPFDDFSFGDLWADGTGLFDGSEDDNIYGDARIIELGDDRLELGFKKGEGKVSFDAVSQAERSASAYSDYPVDVSIQAAEAGTGGAYSDEDLALINEFSCQTKGTC